MALEIIWFLLIGVLITGYAILDGFDLGVGVLHLFAHNDHERRVHMNAIGPVWDGNEVWLLTGTGAIFAAFPPVYATVFSGLYLAVMLLMVALIARAVALEFRSKLDAPQWRKIWDWAFGLGSLLAIVLFGTAVGNLLKGLPIDASGHLLIPFVDLLNPYALSVAVLAMVLFVMHGALYMVVKTEGELQARMRSWAAKSWIVYILIYIAVSVATVYVSPFLFDGVLANPLWWLALVAAVIGIAGIPLAARAKRFTLSFLSSCLSVAAMMGLMGASLFPRMAPSSIDLANSLTIYAHSSTPRTLLTMLVIALIGVPLVLVYTFFVYRTFAGKVQLTKDSY